MIDIKKARISFEKFGVPKTRWPGGFGVTAYYGQIHNAVFSLKKDIDGLIASNEFNSWEELGTRLVQDATKKNSAKTLIKVNDK